MKTLDRFIGSRLNKDIFTNSGTFLLSANTVLREEHIDKLEQYNILLTDNDIVTQSFSLPKSEEKLIQESLIKIKEIFQIASYSNTIPLYEIRKDILPTINQVAENPNLFKVFNELHAKDDYTYTHNLAVAVLASTVGKWLRLSKNDIQTLTISALLHDIGKAKVPNSILNKPEKLTKPEFEEIKRHAEYGYDIIKNTVGASEKIALVALQHHEREDGGGYPNGLKADQIDYFSQIVAVCDVFHAMTSDRVYRKAAPFYHVIKEMRRDSFGKLNTKIMTVFIKRMMDSVVGSQVILSDGRKAKVIMLNPYDPTYPIVKIAEPGMEDEIIDLNVTPSIYIEKVIE